MNNSLTLAQILDMTVERISKIPLDQIEVLLEEIADLKERLAKGGNLLQAAMDRRFSEAADRARRAAGKDSGKITLAEGDYSVVCDLPKKVTWTQSELERIVERLACMGEDPKEYIKTDLTVAETAFKAWPKSLQGIFAPARTVSTGKPAYSLKRGEAA